MRPLWKTQVGVAAMLAAAIACSDRSTSVPPATPSAAILAGVRTDTIEAVVPVAAQVTLETGAAVPNAVVAFAGDGALVSTDTALFGSWGALVRVRTDSTGHAAAFLRLPIVIASVKLRITATVVLGTDSTNASGGVSMHTDTIFVTDSATYTVLHGNPVALTTWPADTALYAGHSYQIRSRVSDRGNNDVPAQPTYAAGPHLTVDTTGSVTATVLTRSKIFVYAAGLTDTAFVTVVPHGLLAAHLTCPGVAGGFATLQLDGSDVHFIGPRDPPVGSVELAYTGWSPDGQSITFTAGGDVHVSDLAGNDRVLAPADPLGKVFPQFSADGTWIYYSAGSDWPVYDLWRMRSDGSGSPEHLGPGQQPAPGLGYNFYWQIEPLGDTTAVFDDGGWGLHHLNLNTLSMDTLSFGQGRHPRYSAVHKLLLTVAVDTNTLDVRNVDGSNVRELALPHGYSSTTLDWSADGKWIIAATGIEGDQLQVINYGSGTALPLKLACHPMFASWQPAASP